MGFTRGIVGPDPGAGSEAGPAPVSAFPSSRPHCSVPWLLWARTAQLHPRVYLIVKRCTCLIFILNNDKEKKNPSFNLGCASN